MGPDSKTLRHFRQELFVLLAAAAIFAAYSPVATWLGRNYVRIPQPTGKLVELVDRFEEQHSGGGFQARVFANQEHAKAILFEDLTPLQEVEIVTLPTRPSGWRFFKIAPRAGFDPRTSGKRYYLVQP